MRNARILSCGLLLLCAELLFAQDSLHIGRLGGNRLLLPVGVAVVDTLAYTISFWGDLVILNVADPVLPTALGSVSIAGGYSGDYFSSIAVAGGYAYVTSQYGGLYLLDVHDPLAPVEVDSLMLPGGAADLKIVAPYAYVCGRAAGLRVLDLSDPAAPVPIGLCDVQGYATRLAVQGGYAYVTTGSGLRIVDIHDPAAPVLTGAFTTAQAMADVAVSGRYAYVADFDRLRIIDIQDPAHPQQVGLVTVLEAEVGNVVYACGYVITFGDWGGLRAFDVHDPAAPVEVGYCDPQDQSAGPGNDLTLAGCIAYTARVRGFVLWDVSYFLPCGVPRAPERLVLEALPGQHSVRLSWLPVAQDTCGTPITVDYYTICRSDAVDAAFDSIGFVPRGDSLCFLDSTAAAIQRYYQVKAVVE